MNRTNWLALILFSAVILLLCLWISMPGEINLEPTDEEAELVGINFIQDVINFVPDQENIEAGVEAYLTLSSSAKEKVSPASLGEDLINFVDLIEIEEMEVESFEVGVEKVANLIISFNYGEQKEVRQLRMIIEENEWRVDEVIILN